MKKIIVGLSLVFVMMISIIGNVHAATAKVNMQTAKTEFSKNETVIVDVKLSEIRTTKGAAAFMATLEYDKNSLQLEKMEGQNGWSNNPSYNEANGKLVMDKSNNITNNEDILKLTFKVKETAKSSLVTLNDISVSGGEGDIEITAVSKNIAVKSESDPIIPDKPTDPDKNNTVETPITNNTTGEGTLNIITNNTQNKDTVDGKMPQTGVNDTILTVGIAVAAVFAIVCMVRIKMLNKM
ncbi:MAG: hypothetical protein HFJ28_06510 [Clostridia bacterium]|nr:hypothetical protein [Clostridia bacterium]